MRVLFKLSKSNFLIYYQLSIYQYTQLHVLPVAMPNTSWGAVQEVKQYECLVAQMEALLTGNTPQKQKELNCWILRHSELFQSEAADSQQTTLFLSCLQTKLNSAIFIDDSIRKCELRGVFQDVQILNLLQSQKGLGKLRLRFSEELKGICMNILSPRKASMTMGGSQRMLLLQPALTDDRGLKTWRVKIEKLACWIGVGVAHLDSIRAANFEFSYTGSKHGNYLISSNGYSWNGYKMEFNSKLGSFQFSTADVIEVSQDPNSSKLSFQKQGHDNILTYEVDPSQKPIHAAVNLTGVGDCVQILQ